MKSKRTKLGVIGGSGLYQMSGAKVIAEHNLNTPFGKPSDLVFEMELKDRRVYFLARHGRKHTFLPQEVNYRANIYAMKMLGVTHLAAISAVGSLKEKIAPGEFHLPDQLIDWTSGSRPSSFMGEGVVGHFSCAEPFCGEMRELLAKSQPSTVKLHQGGTYLCIEGPQFSTKAESNFYRQQVGASVIGMTAVPEAKLAREAELSYALLAMVTDYDCWNDAVAHVSVEAVLGVMKQNSEAAQTVIANLCENLPQESKAPSLFHAGQSVMTPFATMDEKQKQKLQTLYSDYFL